MEGAFSAAANWEIASNGFETINNANAVNQYNSANFSGRSAGGPVITEENGGITFTGRRDTDTEGKNNKKIKDPHKSSKTSLKNGGPGLNGSGDYGHVFDDAKGEDYDPTETSYGTTTQQMQDDYGVKFGDVGYSQNTKIPGNNTKFIIADKSPERKYGQEGSQKGNVDLGLKKASGNNGFDDPIIKTHIFTGSVKYFTDKSLLNGRFYTSGHLPNQSQINALVDYLITLYKIVL